MISRPQCARSKPTENRNMGLVLPLKILSVVLKISPVVLFLRIQGLQARLIYLLRRVNQPTPEVPRPR